MSDDLHPHQCPYCELRFRSVNETHGHVITDHPEHEPSFAKAQPHER
jgi:hypothetical protein